VPSLDMSVWTGRDDILTESPSAIRWHQRVQPFMSQADKSIVLLGFACDEGVTRNGGRAGAAGGPKSLRSALANMAWHQDHPVFDAGDVTYDGADLESVQEHLAVQIAELIAAGQRPLTLGGGHETAWSTMQGMFRARPQSSIGLINIDAHFDLRASVRSTSGTPFAQAAAYCRAAGRLFRYFCLGVAEPANTAALFERAHELGVLWRLDTELHAWKLDDELERVRRFIAGCDLVYLSLDLDVLPNNVMPAVSAPAGRGVPLDIVERLVAEVVASGKLAAADVVEFNPLFDVDGRAARTAAALIWQIARGWTGTVDTAK
jgi:formiminoglutamase